MSFLMAVKIFADLCLYFGLAGGAAPWFGGTEMFLLCPALLCAGGVWLAAAGEHKPILRFAGLVLPMTSFLLAQRPADFFLLAPALIYTLIVLLMGRFALGRDQYHDFFFRSLFVAGPLSLLVISYPLSDWRTLVVFMVLYLLLGFFLMRQLRLGGGTWSTRSLNMVSLLSAIAFGGVLCLAAWLVLRLCGPVWELISSGIYLVLSGIVYGVVYLAQFFPDLGIRGPEEVKMPSLGTGNDPMSEQLKDAQNPAAQAVITAIGIGIAVLLAVFVVWRMMRTTRKTKPTVERMGQSERIDVPRETGLGLFSSNRDKIRRSYRKFMQLLHDRGVVLQLSDTTADIHSHAGFLRDTTPAHQLRNLYLTARYDEDSEVTNQQAKEAKDLVKTISKDPELL